MPIEEDPAPVTAREADHEAERACREAGERLAQARQAAGKVFAESRGPGRIFTAFDTWAARRDLPECERAFAEAQARREVTAADLAEARSRARAALAPVIRARLAPRLAAVRDALQAVVPALDHLDGELRALEARGVAVAPIVPAINSAAAIRALVMPYAAAIEGWLAGRPGAGASASGSRPRESETACVNPAQ